MSISIYLHNELIEEIARHRKLIFGMLESFDYGSGLKRNVDSSWDYGVIVTFLLLEISTITILGERRLKF